MPITMVGYQIPPAAFGAPVFNNVRTNANRLQSLRNTVLAAAVLAQEGVNNVSLPPPPRGTRWDDPGDPHLNPPDPAQTRHVFWSYATQPWSAATTVYVIDIH